jgi:hypothetical protein
VERLREAREWARSSLPLGPAGAIVAASAILLLAYLLLADVNLGTLIVLAALGLLAFRFVRNRRGRMIKRLIQKLSRLKEVRAITVRGGLVTVMVDRAQAKTYLRVSSLTDAVSRKLFGGEPIEVAVRDDLSAEDFQQALRESGVAYVRDDAV